MAELMAILEEPFASYPKCTTPRRCLEGIPWTQPWHARAQVRCFLMDQRKSENASTSKYLPFGILTTKWLLFGVLSIYYFQNSNQVCKIQFGEIKHSVFDKTYRLHLQGWCWGFCLPVPETPAWGCLHRMPEGWGDPPEGTQDNIQPWQEWKQKRKISKSIQSVHLISLFVCVLHPGNIDGHIRTGTDLWQLTLLATL